MLDVFVYGYLGKVLDSEIISSFLLHLPRAVV